MPEAKLFDDYLRHVYMSQSCSQSTRKGGPETMTDPRGGGPTPCGGNLVIVHLSTEDDTVN